MTSNRLAGILAAALVLTLPQQLRAQQVTALENLSLRTTVMELLRPLAAAQIGEAVALATSIEVATTPLGTGSAGFVFKLDPVTGLQVRTATTFGPSFAERALTAGGGRGSGGATLSVAAYQQPQEF